MHDIRDLPSKVVIKYDVTVQNIHDSGFFAHLKFPLWRADSKSCGFVRRIHRIRVDVEIFESGKKKSLIQKYRNKGRRGLSGFYYFLFIMPGITKIHVLVV